MVQDCSQDTAMACDRLHGVLVAQQKVVVESEALAGEDGMTKADAGLGSNPKAFVCYHIKTFVTDRPRNWSECSLRSPGRGERFFVPALN
jgi:hypothetical protein